MAGSKPKSKINGQSFALFDRSGRLLDWDSGIAHSVAQWRARIRLGVTLRIFNTVGYAEDPVARADHAAGSQFDPAKRWTFARAIAAAEPRAFDIRTGDGRIILYQELPTSTGGLLIIARDVTAERSASAAFAQAGETWCLDGSPTIEAVTNMIIKTDGSYVFGPPPEELRVVWGLPDDYDLNDNAANLSRMVSTAEERAQNQAMMAEMCSTLTLAWHHCRVRDGQGRLRWIHVSHYPTRLENGDTAITTRHRDITREKVAEDRIELLRSAVTHASDAIQIVHTGPDGRSTTVYANPAFEHATGWRVDEVVGRSIEVMNGWGEAFWDRLQALAAERVESAIEVQVPRRDGQMVWLEVSAKVVERSADGGYRWVLASRNIDERRQVQEELYQAMDEAHAANRAKSEFLANMSHEIRTPMNGIIGMNALLLRSPLSPDQRRFAEAVRVSADGLLVIINDILDISKLEAGKVELESIDFSLKQLVDDAVELLSAKAREKGLELTSEFDEGAARRLRGDPTRLRQIVLNLLSNALKFTERGSISLTVRSHRLPDERIALRLEVRDTGIGLAPEAKAKLFNKFQQADGSISRRYGGTGLGLSICRQLVELMGGRIGVDDRPGGGAIFWFEIALDRSEDQLEADAAKTLPFSAAAQPPCSGRLLLAEDNEINTLLAKTILEAVGYVVVCVVDGREAVEAATRGGFDLILMDMQMPVMDGLQATRLIRGLGGAAADVPILALTANAMEGDRERCHEAGMNGYVSKPIEAEAFLGTVAAHVRGRAPAPNLAARRKTSAGR